MSQTRLSLKLSADDLAQLEEVRQHLGVKKVSQLVPDAVEFFIQWFHSDKRSKRWRPRALQNATEGLLATITPEQLEAYSQIAVELHVKQVMLGQSMIRLWIRSLNLLDVELHNTTTSSTIQHVAFDYYVEQDQLLDLILEHKLVEGGKRGFFSKAIDDFAQFRETNGEYRYESRPVILKGVNADHLVNTTVTIEHTYYAKLKYYMDIDGIHQRDLVYNIVDFALKQYKRTHAHILGVVESDVEASFHVFRSSFTGWKILQTTKKVSDLNAFFVEAVDQFNPDPESFKYMPRPVPEDEPVQLGDLVQRVDPDVFRIERLSPLVPMKHYQKLEHQAQIDGVHIQTVCFNVFVHHLERMLESS